MAPYLRPGYLILQTCQGKYLVLSYYKYSGKTYTG